MKQQINEIKRMQQLAGIIKESQLEEYYLGEEVTYKITDKDINNQECVDFKPKELKKEEEIFQVTIAPADKTKRYSYKWYKKQLNQTDSKEDRVSTPDKFKVVDININSGKITLVKIK